MIIIFRKRKNGPPTQPWDWCFRHPLLWDLPSVIFWINYLQHPPIYWLFLPFMESPQDLSTWSGFQNSMARETNSQIIRRILKIALVSQIVIIGMVYAFTKSPIYCIITILATAVGILSFLAMIKLIDRYLTKRKGIFLIFFSTFFKIGLITAIFYPLSKISDAAIFFFILGLSTIVISTIIEGIYQIFRKTSNGRT